MKRKYKILIIVLISLFLAYFIYFFNREEKINLVAIGDGIASGETSYNVDGVSYNDYLKDYFENKKLLKNYYKTFASKNYKLNDLLNDLKSNIYSKDDDLYIKQVMHKADIITINIGEEELVKLQITKDLNKEYLQKFFSNFDSLLYILKSITEAKIVIVGFYENNYLDKSNVIILNSEISNIAIKYDSSFVNINDLMQNKEYFLNDKNLYFNYKGHKVIAEMIIHSL